MNSKEQRIAEVTRPRRLRAIHVDDWTMKDILLVAMGKLDARLEIDLPEDATLVGVQHSFEKAALIMMFEHPSFPEHKASHYVQNGPSGVISELYSSCHGDEAQRRRAQARQDRPRDPWRATKKRARGCSRPASQW